MPTVGSFEPWPSREPWKDALPYVKTPPSAATSQYPCAGGVCADGPADAVAVNAPLMPSAASGTARATVPSLRIIPVFRPIDPAIVFSHGPVARGSTIALLVHCASEPEARSW